MSDRTTRSPGTNPSTTSIVFAETLPRSTRGAGGFVAFGVQAEEAASYVPARRAAGADPRQALEAE